MLFAPNTTFFSLIAAVYWHSPLVALGRAIELFSYMVSPMAGFAEVLVEFRPTQQGGRRTPISLGEDATPHYMPHFRLIDGDGAYLGVEFVEGPDNPVSPGDRTYATVRFMYEPQVSCMSRKSRMTRSQRAPSSIFSKVVASLVPVVLPVADTNDVTMLYI